MMYPLGVHDVVPSPVRINDYGVDEKWPVACFVGGNLVFFVLLFSYMGILQLLGLKQPGCFLDKVCIHQTDEDLKAAGIDAISTFLHSSKTMVVLYDAGYFSRLSGKIACAFGF